MTYHANLLGALSSLHDAKAGALPATTLAKYVRELKRLDKEFLEALQESIRALKD